MGWPLSIFLGSSISFLDGKEELELVHGDWRLHKNISDQRNNTGDRKLDTLEGITNYKYE